LPQAIVIGVDINPQAIVLAEVNKKNNALTNVTFKQSDLFTALEPGQKFDLVVSNPPYISREEYEGLESVVKKWEDPGALIGGDNGLVFYERIAQQAAAHLNDVPHGDAHVPCVVVELGNDPHAVKALFEQNGFKVVRLFKDMQGVERWLACCK